ncbi:hypothetical protein GYMLUDRAFT_248003 [Collybiopsis luxurians FD-317 M1]|uniref:Uncharacterized protein n=1 Tax=Collybiopsis luxurians FD-317 M1 TaxID=944289 RepID=A0A0D0C1P9_9AGAR|nr:hypothetical protein GYMLUDRAFT_248003 [Collybiopsis luxurians FD-317 M1]
MSNSPSGIPPQALQLPNLNATLGALEIGLVMSTLLLGIAWAQGYTFFSRSAKELTQEPRHVLFVV